MPGNASANKSVVVGGSLGGAIATVLIWAAHQFFGIELPQQVAAAMAVILISIGGWIASKI
jgi:hypothetical protein